MTTPDEARAARVAGEGRFGLIGEPSFAIHEFGPGFAAYREANPRFLLVAPSAGEVADRAVQALQFYAAATRKHLETDR